MTDPIKRLGKGVLVINSLYLKKQKPSFRSDVNYEDHVLRVLMEYAEYAIENEYSLLFVGESLKAPTVRQALMLMELKFKLPMYVHESQAHKVNSALIDMNCVGIIDDNHVLIKDKVLSFIDDGSQSDKWLVNEGGEWHLHTKRSKGNIHSVMVPPAIASLCEAPPGALVVDHKIKAATLASTVDDGSLVVHPLSDELSGFTDSAFTERLKEISHQQLASGKAPNDVSIQSLINDLPMGDAKDNVQRLFNDVTNEATDLTH